MQVIRSDFVDKNILKMTLQERDYILIGIFGSLFLILLVAFLVWWRCRCPCLKSKSHNPNLRRSTNKVDVDKYNHWKEHLQDVKNEPGIEKIQFALEHIPSEITQKGEIPQLLIDLKNILTDLQIQHIESYFQRLDRAYEKQDIQQISDILLDRQDIAEVLMTVAISSDQRAKFRNSYNKSFDYLSNLILKRHPTNLVDSMRELAEGHDLDLGRFECYSGLLKFLTRIFLFFDMNRHTR